MIRLVSTLTAAGAVALALASSAGADYASSPVRVHAIFGGSGFHVGQVLDVRAHGQKATQVCWDPAPIDRPACSASENGAPSATGPTKLTLTLTDGSTVSRTIQVAPAFRKIGGRGGSNAAPGHVTCHAVTVFGNPARGSKPARDKVTTLHAGDRVAIYNRIGKGRFVWQYATNKAGFARATCLARGL
jgi:hypothetical protein